MSHPSATVRPTRLDEVELLPPIERSAATAFLALPELAWVATDDTLPPEAHRHFIELGGSWVVEVGGHIIGFACAERYDDDLHLWEVSVAREHQGQGAGSALLDALAAHAARHGLRRITLTTFRDVPWNEGFYEGLGFRVLEHDELDHRLAYVLDLEDRQGLPLARRCAMARVIAPGRAERCLPLPSPGSLP